METCIGWLLDVYIEDDNAILWIKTHEGKVIKLIDNYSPSFYILPKTDHDRVQLLQLFSQQTDIVKQLSCELKYTNLFDSEGSIKNLIFVSIESVLAYKHILKKLEKDPRVEELFNTDLLDVQQYLFTKLKIEPTSKVRVEYDGLNVYRITKIDDTTELAPPPFSFIYVEIKTGMSSHEESRISSPYVVPDNNPILTIRVRDQYNSEYLYFQESDEELLIRNFANSIMDKDPDIIVSTEPALFQNLFERIKKLGFEGIQLGRDDVCCVVDDDTPFMSIKNQRYWWIRGRVCISSSRHGSSISISSSDNEFGLISLVERSRLSFLPLGLASKYGTSRLIDSRNCYELIQKDFVIPSKESATNHEQIRTIEDIVENDKGGMIISPQIGLHENVVVLDYENEYANLIVKHNLSYETFTSSSARGSIAESHLEKALLPTVVENVLKRRTYFKELLKKIRKENLEQAFLCEQRVEALKKILVSLYGTTGSVWNRFGNVFAFEEINRLARDILLKTKDIVQRSGFELVYADTDSVFLKKEGAKRMDYENLVKILSRETGLSISLDYHYKFLVLLPLEADEKLEALKHYFGITYDGELVMRGIETRRHDSPNFIKQFQNDLLRILFDCKDSSEIATKGYENALLVVTQTIDRIMTGEGIQQQDLVISKLLRQGIDNYKCIFPHVAAALQLSNEGKIPMKGDNIQYIYTNSEHKNPLCRVAALPRERNTVENMIYDKEKYLELLLSAAQTVLGYFGFDPRIYVYNQSNNKKRKWWDELRQERARDIDAESTRA